MSETTLSTQCGLRWVCDDFSFKLKRKACFFLPSGRWVISMGVGLWTQYLREATKKLFSWSTDIIDHIGVRFNNYVKKIFSHSLGAKKLYQVWKGKALFKSCPSHHFNEHLACSRRISMWLLYANINLHIFLLKQEVTFEIAERRRRVRKPLTDYVKAVKCSKLLLLSRFESINNLEIKRNKTHFSRNNKAFG